MLSGEKKKYGPYLDTGLMNEVAKQADNLGISVNEYLTLALTSFVEKTSDIDEKLIKHWTEKIWSSQLVKNALETELSKLLIKNK